MSAFADMLTSALRCPNLDRELARAFEVSVPAISCWANGTARPHPLLQKQVVEWLLERAYGRR